MTNTEAQQVLGTRLMRYDLTDAELEAIRMAEEALDDEAMMITEKSGGVAICPACGATTLITKEPPCFCIVCGQKLGWEEEQ